MTLDRTSEAAAATHAPTAVRARSRFVRSRLGLRVFAVLFVLNLVVFSGLGGFLADRLERQRAELVLGLTEQLVATLETTIRPGGDLNVARILQWPGWVNVTDALVVDRNLERSPSGRLWPRGVALHPVGQAGPSLRGDALFEALAQTMERRERIELAGGVSVPIDVDGRVWGALWFAPREDPTGADLSRLLWIGFALSTTLLLVGTFAALRPLVIDPVERLALAATRVSRGDLSARVEVGERNDEVSELLRAFNAMALRVEELSRDLEREVSDALAAARRAERAVVVQQRLAAMGQLAAGIAHEINNPLGGLMNAVTALRGERIDPARRERYLALLGEGLERIRVTVGQVLRMAPREMSADRIDLVDVVRDACALVRHRVESGGVRLVARIGGLECNAFDPPNNLRGRFEVVGARQELAQALLNLVVNALDAVAEREGAGRIEVGVFNRGEHVALVVHDDGPGVPADRIDRLTDLFYTTKEVGSGTGLGLSIVHNVIDSHGGTLVLASSPGEGFTATCLLPKAVAA